MIWEHLTVNEIRNCDWILVRRIQCLVCPEKETTIESSLRIKMRGFVGSYQVPILLITRNKFFHIIFTSALKTKSAYLLYVLIGFRLLGFTT